MIEMKLKYPLDSVQNETMSFILTLIDINKSWLYDPQEANDAIEE